MPKSRSRPNSFVRRFVAPQALFVLSCLLALGAKAEPVPPQESCRVSYGCGLVISDHLDSHFVLSEITDLVALQAKLLANPRAPGREWSLLMQLLGDDGSRSRRVAEYFRRDHWQEPPADIIKSLSLSHDRLFWLDLWRHHNPQEVGAWCQWASEAAESLGHGAVISELESARAQDPRNQALNTCLMKALKRAGRQARLQEIVGDDEPGPNDARSLGFLPAELQSAFAFESQYGEAEDTLEILERAHLAEPENLEIELLLLEYSGYAAVDEEEEERIEARLLDLAADEHPVALQGQICESLHIIGDYPVVEACQERFADRIAEAGFHLGPTPAPKEARVLGDEHWNELVFDARALLVRRAIRKRDLDALAQLLLQGPGYGYADLWSEAVDLAESTHDPEVGSPEEDEIQAQFHEDLCGLLAQATHDGSLEKPVFSSGVHCPERLSTLAGVFRQCELEEERKIFLERLRQSLESVPWPALAAIELKGEDHLSELEKRLESADLDAENRRLLENEITTYALKALDPEPLVRQGERLLQASQGLSTQLTNWFRKVRKAPAASAALVAALLEERPDDRQLRLRLAYESLRAPEPDLQAVLAHASRVHQSKEATLRERADASYLLGRVAILEGQPERATPLLAAYFEARLEHSRCPATLPGCDRDYVLHLISLGDWPRLEAYWSRRLEKVAESHRRLKAEGIEQGQETPVGLELMQLQPVVEDPFLHRRFLLPDCGLPSALPHIEKLAQLNPEDPAIQERLERERARTCVHEEGPFPWSAKGQILAGTLEQREEILLLSSNYP